MGGDVTGAVLSALFGLVADCNELFAGYQLKSVFAEGDAFRAILKYAAAGITIAVGTGATVGTTVGNTRQVSRLIGAAMPGEIIAAILYPPASAIRLVSKKSDQFLPTRMWSKSVWRSAAGIFMPILITWMLTDRTNTESH